MKIKLRYHLLAWATILYFVASESLVGGVWVFYPLIVGLPWWLVVRSKILEGPRGESRVSVSPVLWGRFLLLFLKEFLLANWDLIKILWSSSPPPQSVWTEARTKLESSFSQVLIANFISLTPGTISWEVESNGSGAVIRVHALNEASIASLQPLVDRLDQLLVTMASEARGDADEQAKERG
jgi:multisubunit Na+/H+ antiporter MnhE subunit